MTREDVPGPPPSADDPVDAAWWQVVVSVAAADADLAADRLWLLGTAAIEEVDDDGRVVLIAAFEGRAAASAAAVAVASGPPPADARIRPVLDDGLDGWRDGFAPVATRRWWLVPTWGDAPTSVPGDGRPALHLDPGRTFGSGSHPTTRLCVDAVADAVESATSRRAATTIRVLDVGAGSGVLAIAGVLAGAAEATAIDIDPASPAVVVANAATNGIGDRIAASEEPLAAVVAAGHRFEVVAANLLAPVVRDLATDLVAALAPAGTLIVSGLLADRWGDAVGGLVAAGAEVVEVTETDGWVAVVLRGPSGSAAS